MAAVHTQATNATLAFLRMCSICMTRVTFSRPPVWGELPGTGAIVMDHAVLGGAIFVDNGQARKRDKVKRGWREHSY